MKTRVAPERFVALVAGGLCASSAALVWRMVSAYQPVWPLPALYFAELAVVGVAVIVAFARESAWRALMAWGAGGIVAAFSILGAWTVGLLFVPSALGLLAAGIAADFRTSGRIGAHAGVGLLAALTQSAVMLALAAWL